MFHKAENMSIAKARQIFYAGLDAVMPDKRIRDLVKVRKHELWVADARYTLKPATRIIIVGAGKASALMAKALEEILGTLVSSGIVIVKYGHAVSLNHVCVEEAAHPIPDQNSLDATKKLVSYCDALQKEDIVFFLLSGGASSLLVDDPYNITLLQLQDVYTRLLHSGANIYEMNCVRKHLSRVKGGGIAKAVFPAQLISMILSDVPYDDLQIIGSGPTVADDSTFESAKKILEKYSLWTGVSSAVRKTINNGITGQLAETVKRGDNVLAATQTVLIGTNRQALMAAAQQARLLGYLPITYTKSMDGDAAKTGRLMAKLLQSIDSIEPICFLVGGETTVKVKGKGRGGRCQELVMAAAKELKDNSITLLAAGTDGSDGPTDAAGAYLDKEILEKIQKSKINIQQYAVNNDSYMFFKKLGAHFTTGPTLTNVMDIVIVLIHPSKKAI